MLDINQLISLCIVILALILTGVSFIAYIRTRLKKFLIVSLAFLFYMVKEFIEHIDIVFPNIEMGTIDLLLKSMDFIIIALFFLAVVIKETKQSE